MKSLIEGLRLHPDNVQLMTERAVWADSQGLRQPASRYSDAELQHIKVDIIVCVHNALDEVVQCLSSVQSRTRTPFGVIIVDDASNAEVRAYLDEYRRAHSNVQVLRNDSNLGYTKSANRGLKFSKSEWVVLLNSDTVVTDGWLSGLLLCAARDQDVRAVGPLSNAATFQSIPRIRDDRGEFLANKLPEGWSPEDVNRFIRENNLSSCYGTPVLNGFCTLFHRPTVESLGYLDEDGFPVGYGEENDLCLRMLRAGYRLVIASGVYVYHNKSASFGGEARKRLTLEGVMQLKARWPGYSYGYISRRVSEIPGLKKLRERLLEAETEYNTGSGAQKQR